MVSINTAAFTTWELPSSLNAAATQVKAKAESFAAHIESAGTHWAGLQEAYRGPSEATLWAALQPAEASAEYVRNAGALSASALEEFATELQTLIDRRNRLVAEIAAFNTLNAGNSEEELSIVDQGALMRLPGAVESLQQSYEFRVTQCAGLLARIRPGQISDGEFTSSLDGLTNWRTYSGVSGWFDVQTTNTWQGFESSTQVPGRAQPIVVPVEQNARFTGSSTHATLFNSPLGPGLAAAGGAGLTTRITQALKNDHAPGSTWQQRLNAGFPQRFAGGLPGVADYLAWKQTSGPTVKTSFSDPRISHGSDGSVRTEKTVTQTRSSATLGNVINRGATAGGTVLTIGTAAVSFTNEREMRQQELAQQNPAMSDAEINSEATHDAAAFTVGSTGSSILASAAAGAAIGSVVPVGGTAVGFAAGVLTGVVMEAPMLPDLDGDGQRDSVADAFGIGAEKVWDAARTDGVDAIRDAGSSIAEGAEALAEGVSNSKLNPSNWF
ncbi:hypothetical protein [Nesterenkonia jeotgali]|uniref:Uncharacterized protein n=1 Tax=Nesterenkonia jeotgali TaxID=317018 RepID=A0A0W8II37_9MICC|nr:hypothetical protein [Nesterenkonia jeotgali]KUG59594.1 hypothetical protein AVL63_10700 [Nesterenkonia jeotgali]MBA8922182.1 hypothetical protein [Nesterenkonia jeotgali]